jgi:hypothetical protein
MMGRAISHLDVVESLVADDVGRSTATLSSLRSCCKRWCMCLDVDLDDPAEYTLGDTTFENKMQQFNALLTNASPSTRNSAKNVRTAAWRMRDAYKALLSSQDLPTDFNSAFRMAMDAKQYKPADLNQILKQQFYGKERPNWHGAQLWAFYDGTARPGRSWRGDSCELLTRCEEVLDLPANALVSRAYRASTPILLCPPGEIPYRRARSEQWEAKYALRQLPARIQKIWTQFVDWRFQKTHLVHGALYVTQPHSLWGSMSSAKKHRESVLRFLGWLCLPLPAGPAAELTAEERWRAGKGMRPEHLRMAHLFDQNLLWEFTEFQRSRQHNRELTKSHLDLLLLANSFVSTPYAFLVAHPEMAEEFGQTAPSSIDTWCAQVEQLHQTMLNIIRSARRAVRYKQRSPDEPLRHVLDHEMPYSLFLELVERAEQDEPLRALTQTWSVWARDVVVFRMELEVPLRAKNLLELRVGRHLNRDNKSGLWHVHVPKHELKNYYSDSAKDISRNYSEATSLAIDRYYEEARQNFVGHGLTDVFLLGPAAGRRASTEFARKNDFQLSIDSLDRLIGKRLKQYFGRTQGSNIFRHLIATAILKDDPTQVDVAAAILNNSPHSVRENYKHLTQEDGLRLGRTWLHWQARRRPPKQNGN